MRLADSRGYRVVAILQDNDISAFSGQVRPDYRKLLAAIMADQVDVVIAWHTDRLHRSPRELEEYITVSEAHSVDTVTVQAGELDLSTASGRMVARMLGAAARHESEQKSERVRRHRQQAAQAGQANGRLGYGYNDDHSINIEQARILREAADRLLAGETLYSVTTDLNRRGVASPRRRANGWKSANLRGTITRATIAGWREWRPGTSTTKGGTGLGEFLAQGTWQAILPREDVEKLRAILFNPTKVNSRRPPENLLTGLLRCGICKLGLNGSGDNRNKRNPRRYRCIRQPGDAHCGRVSIIADPVDAMIEAAVLEVLSGSRLRSAKKPKASTSAAEQELHDAQNARDELSAARARDDITPEEWAVMRRVVMDRIDRAKHAIAVTGGASVLHQVPAGKDARAWWTTATTAQKRAVIAAVIDSVEVAPARTHNPRFDASRVGEPVWLI